MAVVYITHEGLGGMVNHPALAVFHRRAGVRRARGRVKNRDPRIGACADTGHWVRSAVKPIEALKILEGRVFSSHLKDLNEFGTTKAHDVPYGTGVSGIKEILDELRRQNFDGNISIEYEFKQEDNLAEVTQCIEFVKKYKPA